MWNWYNSWDGYLYDSQDNMNYDNPYAPHVLCANIIVVGFFTLQLSIVTTMGVLFPLVGIIDQ
jgi:hypothetical protein